MRTPVLSDGAEKSITLIRLTLAQHAAIAANLPQLSEARRLGMPNYDRTQVEMQSAFVRIISITESFCASSLTSHVEGLTDTSAHPIIAAIWEKSVIDATGTWNSQKEAYKKWLNVSPAWNLIDGLVEARNAITHGLGTLTRRQLRTEQSTRAKIAAAGISLTGTRIVLTEASLGDASTRCCALVSELDSKLAA